MTISSSWLLLLREEEGGDVKSHWNGWVVNIVPKVLYIRPFTLFRGIGRTRFLKPNQYYFIENNDLTTDSNRRWPRFFSPPAVSKSSQRLCNPLLVQMQNRGWRSRGPGKRYVFHQILNTNPQVFWPINLKTRSSDPRVFQNFHSIHSTPIHILYSFSKRLKREAGLA